VRTRLLAAVLAALLSACSGGNVEPELITSERQLTGLLDTTVAAVAPGAEPDLRRREAECQDADLAGTGRWRRDQRRTWTMPAAEVDALVEVVAAHWREQGHEVRPVGGPGDAAAFATADDGLRASIERSVAPGAAEVEVHLAGSTGCHEPVVDPPFDAAQPPPTPLDGSQPDGP
jgi:hypothetical protein